MTKEVSADLERLVNVAVGQMNVCEWVERYLKIKTGVREGTKVGHVTVQRVLAKKSFRAEENQNCENIRRKAVSYKAATGRWKEF